MPTLRLRLRCDCGHSWDHPAPPPADLRDACPRCRGAVTASVGSMEIAADPPNAGPFRPGDTLNGYEILAEINRGGMGAIYQARQLGLNRTVVLKVILPDRAGSQAVVARFEREVQAAAKLAHPNIVTVFATDLTAPVPYLVMEYVPGIDLHRLVRQAGPLAPGDAVRYIRQAADGLQHAHEQGLVHRDIKPANLMVTPSPLDPPATPPRRPVVKILDMGLARATGGAADLTRAGEFLGTPDYVSPEQAQNAAAADIRADLFSLGGTLYFLLTGDPPISGDNLLEKLSRLLTESPPRVRDKRPELPDDLDHIVQTLLARDPADRYQTPADLLDALDDLLASGQLGGATPGGPATGRIPLPPPSSKQLAPRAAATPAPGPTTVVAPAVAAAHPGGVRAVAAAGDGDTLVTAGPDATLRVWDAHRLAERRRMTGDVGAVTAAAVGPSGGWAVSTAVRMSPADVGVQVWDLVAHNELARLTGPTDNPLCVAVSGDGRRIAAGTADKEVWVWPLAAADGKPVRFRGHVAPLAAVLFLPGGDTLLTGDETGQVRQWDLRTNTGRGAMTLAVGRLHGLAFSGSKGKQVAAAGANGLVLRGRDGSLSPLAGHIGAVRAVAYNPAGTRLASAGADGTVRVWAAADGQPVATFAGFAGAAWCVCWAADGASVFAGGADGTLRRWPAPAA